jgi:tetratricopeptide (TPR) repeat protein
MKDDKDIRFQTISIKMPSILLALFLASTSVLVAQTRQVDPATREMMRLKDERLNAIMPIYRAAVVQYNLASYQNALVMAREALRLEQEVDPEPGAGTHIRILLGEVFIELNRLDEAEEQIEMVAGTGYQQDEFTALRVILDVKRGKLPQARQRMNARVVTWVETGFGKLLSTDLLNLRNGNGNSLHALALVLKSENFSGSPEIFVPILRRAKELAPQNHAIRYLLGSKYRTMFRWPEAKAELLVAAQSTGTAGTRARRLLKQGALRPIAP